MDPKNNTSGLDWNATIEDDSDGYRLLTPGEYNAKITFFERTRYNGGEKLPPCNMAVLTLSIETEDGPLEMKTNLMICRKLEWKLSAFFRAIGRKKHGQRLVMNWDGLVGLPLRVHIANKKVEKDGETRFYNDVDRYIDYDPKNFPSDPEWLQECMSIDELEDVF